MSNPDEIRQDIERTRGELGYDVDALADKVRPSSIAHRQADKVRGVFGSAKDAVFGAASDAKSSVSSAGGSLGDKAGQVGSTVAGAPKAAVRKAEGHPIAVGLMAFGAGLLVSSLIPSSSKERELAQSAKEAAEPLTQQLTDAAKDAAQNLKQPAQEAAESVKSTAQEAVHNVKGEGQTAADDVKQAATDAKDAVQGSVQSQSEQEQPQQQSNPPYPGGSSY